MKKAGLLMLVCAACAVGEEVSVRTLPKRFAADEWKILSSPFRPSSYNAQRVTRYIVPFALVTGALIATDRRSGAALPNTQDQRVWSGRVSQLGAWYSLTGISGATYLAGRFTGNGRAQETGLLALEALGHAQVSVFAIKQLTNRERPQDDAKGRFWQGGTSFPSGHSAGAFAVATVFAHEYQGHRAVPVVAYSLATAVSLSRVGAQKHWPSDIFVGGTIGYLMGRTTFKRHHQDSLRGSRLMPQVGMVRGGAALHWKF
ncbi:MAG: phosphatase PAP2 family protein [Bryobacteraceae bacterium]|nr:phosphatase PAP2 family protein [Bryobacteraceae bacterium]